MEVEVENAIDEIREIIEKCINCGMCKSLCPVFGIIREEAISPRGKISVLKKDIYDKIMYKCSFCKACEEKCPLNLKLCEAFKKARLVLVASQKETDANKKMIANIRQDGNPFGKEKGKAKELFCC